MTLGSIAFLVGVVAAFLFFGVSLTLIERNEKRHRKIQVDASRNAPVPLRAKTVAAPAAAEPVRRAG